MWVQSWDQGEVEVPNQDPGWVLGWAEGLIVVHSDRSTGLDRYTHTGTDANYMAVLESPQRGLSL